MEQLEDTRLPDDSEVAFYERIEEEVESATLKELCDDLFDLYCYKSAIDPVWVMVRDAWRGDGVRDIVDILLFELYNQKNLETFITSLRLEKKFRETLTESRFDYEYNRQ